MKTTLIFLLFTALLSPAAEPLATEKAKQSASFAEMRMQYARRAEYEGGGWTVDEEREALLKAYDEENPRAFLDGSEKWLKRCPVDAKVHSMRASLLMKTGDFAGQTHHRMMYYGLLASLLASGDGRTPATAWKVIAVDEEYTLFKHIGAKLISQSLIDGPCDKMEVEIAGKSVTLFFDVSIPMAAQGKALEGAGK
jgi:Domain of unknown function (DUF4919)